LQRIESAIESAADKTGANRIHVSYITAGSEPGNTTFRLTVDGTTVEQVFEREHIEDSAQRLDSLAETRVRLLVSKLTS
jgi:hypothetical protein